MAEEREQRAWGFLFSEFSILHRWKDGDALYGIQLLKTGGFALINEQGELVRNLTLREALELKAKHPDDLYLI